MEDLHEGITLDLAWVTLPFTQILNFKNKEDTLRNLVAAVGEELLVAGGGNAV